MSKSTTIITFFYVPVTQTRITNNSGTIFTLTTGVALI